MDTSIKTRPSTSTPAVVRPLNYDAGPMVWVDCEMTGLDKNKDKIIEIAVLITNGSLDLVDDGIQYVIHHEKNVLDSMDEWCIKQHGVSGLTEASLASTLTLEMVASKVLEYMRRWVPFPRAAILAGNSVHFDRAFLEREMPGVINHLHYRIIDVSTIKELCRRWYPFTPFPQNASPDGRHRALSDIRGSLQELQWYRKNIFVQPGLVSNPSPLRRFQTHAEPLQTPSTAAATNLPAPATSADDQKPDETEGLVSEEEEEGKATKRKRS